MADPENVFGFEINPILGDPSKTIKLSEFAGKVLLIVNVACE
jgi:glutathione peroxidase-family protein